MKKIKILAVVLIGLLMAGGLVLAGCDEGSGKCSNGWDCTRSKCSSNANTCNYFRYDGNKCNC
jgi:hypothetical protein